MSRHALQLFEQAHIIAQVRTLGANPEQGKSDLPLMRHDHLIVGMADALSNPQAVRELSARNVRACAMELMPRITRAQSMDVLSSMGTIIGYKAVLMAADALPKMFPMLMTAAGTVVPAKVLIIGAGVAGLQAISMARRLGASVEAYDLRPTVKEQVLSLGAKFVDYAIGGAGRRRHERLCQSPGRGILSTPANIADESDRRKRRGDYHSGGTGTKSPGLDHRRDGGRHGSRVGHH